MTKQQSRTIIRKIKMFPWGSLTSITTVFHHYYEAQCHNTKRLNFEYSKGILQTEWIWLNLFLSSQRNLRPFLFETEFEIGWSTKATGITSTTDLSISSLWTFHFEIDSVPYPSPAGAGRWIGPLITVSLVFWKQTLEKFNWLRFPHFASESSRKIKKIIEAIQIMFKATIENFINIFWKSFVDWIFLFFIWISISVCMAHGYFELYKEIKAIYSSWWLSFSSNLT